MMVETNQSYLLALLLASLCASCTSDCTTTYPTDEPLYSHKPPYHDECAKLYSMLEAALVQNPDNLYRVYDIFFPSSGVEPTYVNVYFTLYKTPNESSIHAYSSSDCWTSSIVLKSVDPGILAAIQPNLLNQLLQTVGASELTNKLVYGEQLSLGLLVNITVSDLNPTTVNAVVQDFTLLLKVYASTQRRRSSWTAADLQYKGYRCSSTLYFWTPEQSLLVSIAVLTVAITTAVLIKMAPKVYQSVASQCHNSASYSFFWAASFVASVCNIALLSYEITNFSIDLGNGYGILIIIKIGMMLLLFLLDILVTVCIPKSTEFPIPKLVYVFSFLLCCSCCCFIWCVCSRHSRQLYSKWIQTLALTSLFIFAQFIALSALPTIIWAFVFPIQTLAVIAFFVAALFCMTALIALLLRNIGQVACSRRCLGSWSIMQLLLIPMVVLFLAVVILSFYLYLQCTSGIKTNQVGGFIASFLPSAILTIIGWFVTKGNVFKQTLPQESDSTSNTLQVDPPTEETPLIGSSNM